MFKYPCVWFYVYLTLIKHIKTCKAILHLSMFANIYVLLNTSAYTHPMIHKVINQPKPLTL